MRLLSTIAGVGLLSLLFGSGCSANRTPRPVVYVPMRDWREPPAAKLSHPEPGGVALLPNKVELKLHDPMKRVSVKTPDCKKSGVMATCYEEVN